MNFLPRFRPKPFLSSTFGFATAVLVSAFSLSPASAQQGKTIKSIDVQYVGTQTVSKQRILSQIASKTGEPLSINQVDADVKSLYKGGDVDNVRVLTDNVSGGVALIFVVQTRAQYGGVEFRGNTLIDDGKLAKKVALKRNEAIDEEALKTARQDIQEMYRKKGFSEATVTYRIAAPSADGFSTVIFSVDEGTQGVLRDVQFVGNTAFPAVRLKDLMTQKEKGIITAFTGGSSATDAETLAQDVRKIEDFYRDNGYLNAKVTNVSRKRVDAKFVDVVITIDEGSTYQVDSLAINGVQSLSMQEDILPYLKTKAGDSFAGNKLKDDIKLISDQYGRRGYADARVIPRLEEADGGAVRVVLNVTEGRVYRVGQVHIEGNTTTKDKVIRRELPLEPGQPFDTTRIEITERRLENMNYFSGVEVRPLDTSYLDEKDLLIRVVEKPTGTLNFGAGFSSIDSLTGFLEVTEANFDLFGYDSKFKGAGQRFRLSLRGGSERKDASVSFTEPWMFGERLSMTVEGYYRDLQFLSDQYGQQTVGGAVSFRKSLGEFTYGSVDFRGEQIKISPTAFASPLFAAEAGSFMKNSVGLSVTRDTRDNFFLPRKGNKLSFGFEFAGLGGDVDDTIFSAGVTQHFELPYDAIVTLSGNFNRSSDGNHIFTRHFLGGANNLRGFDYRAVGPKDPVSLESLGGKQAWNGTAEVTVPIVDKVRGALFYDAGEVSKGPAGTIGGGVNSNWGVGVRLFILGNAPVRLDYAIPIQTDAFNDEGAQIQFTMGAQF